MTSSMLQAIGYRPARWKKYLQHIQTKNMLVSYDINPLGFF